jgi:hypothetical protein
MPQFPVYSIDSNPEPSKYGAEMTTTMLRLEEARRKEKQRRREIDFKINDFSIVTQDT